MSIRDNQESTGLFEPLMISERSKNQEKLSDMVLELATRSEGFRRSLPPPLHLVQHGTSVKAEKNYFFPSNSLTNVIDFRCRSIEPATLLEIVKSFFFFGQIS